MNIEDRYKFRGKRVDNGEWVYGCYYKHEAPLECVRENKEKVKYYILNTGFADWSMPRPVDMIEVIPETVGQYTGLHDKNGVEIYEGDIVNGGLYNGSYAHGIIEFNCGEYVAKPIGKFLEGYVYAYGFKGLEVIRKHIR